MALGPARATHPASAVDSSWRVGLTKQRVMALFHAVDCNGDSARKLLDHRHFGLRIAALYCGGHQCQRSKHVMMDADWHNHGQPRRQPTKDASQGLTLGIVGSSKVDHHGSRGFVVGQWGIYARAASIRAG